uniref:LysR family transcriptional regulator n=1 Tax=Chitinimonas sp. TaxID=1934313 RepID=UPI0035B3B045
MNRLPPLYSLQVFAVVAREGNMSRAAGRLFLTQSAVSRQIALLEDYLGKPVFARQARGVALTAVGQALLPTVEGAFDAIAKVIAELGPQSTELRIHLPPTLAMRWFLPRLAGYQRLQAGVDVRVTTGHGVGVQLEQLNLDA